VTPCFVGGPTTGGRQCMYNSILLNSFNGADSIGFDLFSFYIYSYYCNDREFCL